MYKRAIPIRAKGLDQMGFATTLDNFADLQIHAGRAAEAAVTSERWLRELRTALIMGSQGSYHSLYALALEHHAERLDAAGRAADAEVARSEAAAIRAKFPEDAAKVEVENARLSVPELPF